MAKLHPFSGMQHLDVAGGTGDVAFRVLRGMAENDASSSAASTGASASAGAAPVQDGANERRGGCVTLCDINPAMLEEGRRRAAAGRHGASLPLPQ